MSDELNKSTILKKAHDVAFRELDERVFIVGAGSTKLVMLNETGTVFWSLLDGGTSLETIATRLVEEFEVTRASALQDCLGFADRLLAAGLVSVGVR